MTNSKNAQKFASFTYAEQKELSNALRHHLSECQVREESQRDDDPIKLFAESLQNVCKDKFVDLSPAAALEKTTHETAKERITRVALMSNALSYALKEGINNET